MKLWLLRHAPVLLPPGLCYGASDVPADDAATRQAAQAAAACLPAGLPVWVSGLRRAQQLGHALLAQRPDLAPARVDFRLNEMNFGCWELQAWDAIPRAAIDDWVKDFAHHRFGGVESTQDVIGRVGQVIAGHHGALSADGQAVWITHAGVIRAATHIAAHGPQQLAKLELWPQDVIAPGSMQVIEFKFD